MTISQHWFRWWLGAAQATGHYLNQWRLSLLTQIWVTRPQWVNTNLSLNWSEPESQNWYLQMYFFLNFAKYILWVWPHFLLLCVLYVTRCRPVALLEISLQMLPNVYRMSLINYPGLIMYILLDRRVKVKVTKSRNRSLWRHAIETFPTLLTFWFFFLNSRKSKPMSQIFKMHALHTLASSWLRIRRLYVKSFKTTTFTMMMTSVISHCDFPIGCIFEQDIEIRDFLETFQDHCSNKAQCHTHGVSRWS